MYCLTPCVSAGGLVTAVAPVVIECQGLWVGWTGLPDFQAQVTRQEDMPTTLSGPGNKTRYSN